MSLAEALRITAKRLESGDRYRWTNMGACNCGHLAQTVTLTPPAEIHRIALERAGDWAEQTREYCPTSGYSLDHVISALLDLGATLSELRDLERLTDPKVLKRIPMLRRRKLDHRSREDVILYMETWAGLLEEQDVVMSSVIKMKEAFAL
jgi:hypothetical protein